MALINKMEDLGSTSGVTGLDGDDLGCGGAESVGCGSRSGGPFKVDLSCKSLESVGCNSGSC